MLYFYALTTYTSFKVKKTIQSITASKIQRYLGINLTKEEKAYIHFAFFEN